MVSTLLSSIVRVIKSKEIMMARHESHNNNNNNNNTDRFGHSFRVDLRKIFYDVKWTELANTGSIDRLLW
jgi:hypothetical protein